MKLFVPSPGHINSLKELLKEKEKIYSIFMAGSPDYIGTGRSNLASLSLRISRHRQITSTGKG